MGTALDVLTLSMNMSNNVLTLTTDSKTVSWGF